MVPIQLNWTRRQVLANASAALGSSLVLPGFLQGRKPDLASQSAAAARQLAGGRSLTLRLGYPAGCKANLDPVVEAFERDTGVRIELVEYPLEYIDQEMLVEEAAGTANYDVALPPSYSIPDLAEAGALRVLDDLAMRHAPRTDDDALYQLGNYYKGGLYGYQTDGDAYLMFYRGDWLEAEGLQVPQTWSELDDLLEHFHDPQNGRFGGALFRNLDYIAWEWWMRLHAKGELPFDDDFEPTIEGEAAVAALEDLIGASRYLTPTASQDGLFENWERFAAGNVFCNIGWGGTQKAMLRDAPDLAEVLVHSPLPGVRLESGVLPLPYFNWGWNFVVSARSLNPEMAYLFSLYATSVSMSLKAVSMVGGFFDPFRASHYQAPEVQEMYGASFLGAHERSMRQSLPDFYLKGRSEYFEELALQLDQANKGSITPRKALALTAASWRRITKRLGSASQQEQWRYLRSQYPAAVEDYLHG